MHPSRQRCTHRAVLVSRPAIYPRKVQTAREWPPLQLAFFIGVSRCRIEVAPDIEVEDPVVAPTSLPRHAHRLERGLPRPISIRIRMEMPLELRLQIRLD